MKDADIVKGLKKGDAEAIEELARQYGDRLIRAAFLLCGNTAEAQDLAQDTLIQAARSARWFRGESALYTWLYGILRNLSRRYYRRRKRIVYTDQLPEPDKEESPDKDPEEEQQNMLLLARAVEKLSAQHREVLILYHYEGMKFREIANHLGVPLGTVQSRIHNATKRLYKIMKKEQKKGEQSGT